MFSTVTAIPRPIREFWEVHEWRHASTVLANAFPDEWEDLVTVMTEFQFTRSDIVDPGRNKSTVPLRIDQALAARGWIETGFDTQIVVDGKSHPSPTHAIDCFKNRVGLEVEWNNKDTFFDRDLNNFRLLHQLDILSVGVILTRATELQLLIASLGRQKSFGSSTTHIRRLLPKIEGGGAGGCPVLVLGITKKLYQGD